MSLGETGSRGSEEVDFEVSKPKSTPNKTRQTKTKTNPTHPVTPESNTKRTMVCQYIIERNLLLQISQLFIFVVY